MELSIIIPAYNEEEGIAGVIRELQAAVASSGIEYEIVVVDDGSRDATAAQARSCGVTVIEQPVNRGYGCAIMTGIRAARYPNIATIDADSSYPAKSLIELLPYVGKFDLIVGRRTGKEYRGRLLKYPARIVFRHLAQYVSGESIPDINSGLRIFNKDVFLSLPSIHICRGFSFSTTMTLMYLAGGYSTKFVPIEYRLRSGASKIRYFRDTLRALQILFEIAVHYNPIKAILPFCLLPLAGMLFFAAAYAVTLRPLWLFSSFISLYTTLLLFAIGMVLLQIRMSGKD